MYSVQILLFYDVCTFVKYIVFHASKLAIIFQVQKGRVDGKKERVQIQLILNTIPLKKLILKDG